MDKRLRGCIAGAIVLYLLAAFLFLFLRKNHREDYFSPPATSRDTPGYRSGSLGLLGSSSRSIDEEWPAPDEMETPERIDGIGETFLLNWGRQGEVAKREAPDPWVDKLTGDDALTLVAYGTWFPGPDDTLPGGADDYLALRFRDPESLETIDENRLIEMGIPADLARMPPSRTYHTPRIRLIFRSRDIDYPRCVRINIGDARTGARVSYDLESLDEVDSRLSQHGDWIAIDSALLIWHDSPLTCRIEMLTGTPVIRELKQEFGEQVSFSDRLRVQWIARREGGLETDYDMTRFDALPGSEERAEAIRKLQQSFGFNEVAAMLVHPDEKSDTPETETFVRASSDDLLRQQCAVLTPDGPDWSWEYEGKSAPVFVASTASSPPAEEPLTLLFLPERTELDFSLAGLPDAPNPREVEDLFELTLPRITVMADDNVVESRLIAYLSVAAQVEWDSSEKWENTPPKAFPADYTFRNETPQSLLNWYLDSTPGAFADYDEETFVLRVNERDESWWERLKGRLPSLPWWMP